MDSEALRIRELVIEAGALLDWMETGRGDLDVVGAALLYLRDELCVLSDLTSEAEAGQAACEMVSSINVLLAGATTDRKGHAAA